MVQEAEEIASEDEASRKSLRELPANHAGSAAAAGIVRCCQLPVVQAVWVDSCRGLPRWHPGRFPWCRESERTMCEGS